MDDRALLESTGDSRDSTQLDEGPKLYASRWHMLTIYCCLCMLNQLVWITFAPIDEASSARFGEVGTGAVNLLAVIFPVLFLPGMFLSGKSMSKHTLRGTMLLCASMMFFGCALRFGAAFVPRENGKVAYGILLLGQAVVALAQPLVLNIPGVIAGRWFGSQERDLATTIGTISNILGQALGQALSPVCVKEPDEGGDGAEDRVENDRGFKILLGWQFAIAVSFFLWTYCGFRSRPPTPPNYSLTKIVHGRSLVKEWRKLLRNRNFVILLAVFGFGLALFTSLITVLDQFLKPCGYNSDDAGNMGAMLVGCGVIGAAIVGSIMDVLHIYRTALKTTIILSVCVMFGLCAVVKPDNSAVLYVFFGLMGMCMIATLPVVIENSLECTYPTSEEVAVGLLFLFGNTLAIGFTYALQGMIELQDSDDCGHFLSPARIFIMSVGLCLGVGVLFYNGPYLRLEEEARHRAAIERNETNTSLTWTPPLKPFGESAESLSNHGDGGVA
eukprot:g1285.t1